jgi:hypothetical protein
MAGGGPTLAADRYRLNRRAFIVLLGGTALGLSSLHRPAKTLAWESIIRPAFPLDDDAIWQLGSSCAELLENCTTLAEVVEHLRPCPSITWVAGGARSTIGRRAAYQSVSRLLSGEYAAGETVIADGWVLSRTEAALCAAAAFRAGHVGA